MHIMSDHYVKVKVQLEQLKSTGEVEEAETAGEEQVPNETPPASLSPLPVALEVRRDASKNPGTARNRSKSRTKLGNYDKSPNTKQDAPVSSHLDNAPSLQVKGTGKVLQEKAEANGNVVTSQPHKDIKSAHSKEDANTLVKKRRPVTVDTSKAKTSLEALKLSIRQLKWKEVRSNSDGQTVTYTYSFDAASVNLFLVSMACEALVCPHMILCSLA